MWKAYQRYRKLDLEAKRLFWRAVLLLALVSFSLRVRGFQRTKISLEQRLAANLDVSVNTATEKQVQKTCRMVKAGTQYGVVRATCLAQSLVLNYLLQQQKIPARLRIGVRKLPEKFEAHAWIEFNGVALNESSETHEHYAAFESEFSNLPGESV